MSIQFEPKYTITNKIANILMRIESAKMRINQATFKEKEIEDLTENVLMKSVYFGLKISKKELKFDEIEEVIKNDKETKNKEIIKNYYNTLQEVKKIAGTRDVITEEIIKKLNNMINGKTSRRYDNNYGVNRNEQDLFSLTRDKFTEYNMKAFAEWLNNFTEIPIPIIAAIAYYQLNTVQYFEFKNDITASLLVNLILYIGVYDVRGLCCLEEYFVNNLEKYNRFLSKDPSNNSYKNLRRSETDFTSWIEFFCEALLSTYKNIKIQSMKPKLEKVSDRTKLRRSLDRKKRKGILLFKRMDIITSNDVCDIFRIRPRTGRKLCGDWQKEGFITSIDKSNKGRKYKLADKYTILL